MQSAVRFLSRWSPRLANKTLSTALEAYRSRDYATALTNFKALAQQNYPDVQVLLAHVYRNGEGTPVDHDEAAKWTRLAADNGHAEAQYILGLIYDDGTWSQRIIARRCVGIGYPHRRDFRTLKSMSAIAFMKDWAWSGRSQWRRGG
jgi:TPR repeat protein